MFYIYLIECSEPNHFYIGQTSNIARRIFQHCARTGSKFTTTYRVKGWEILGLAKTREEAKLLESSLFYELSEKFPDRTYSIGQMPKTVTPSIYDNDVKEVIDNKELTSLRQKAKYLASKLGRHEEACMSLIRRYLKRSSQ